ncbi:toxin-antitoxin system TumE family protein [Geminocystis herdmanii]|uniref:toxin-antitoxin system TumE family protein n=1 Tax=Geminocystis herdmanii TaxID=669359 RepID=UPI0036F33BB9
MKRWDNAPHHPGIKTFPHHLHDDTEDSVFPYTPISLEEILRLISAQISSS